MLHVCVAGMVLISDYSRIGGGENALICIMQAVQIEYSITANVTNYAGSDIAEKF